METTVRETGDMVRVLEIQADASDLETDVRLALKRLRSKVTLRGFRPGHVPIEMIRRIFRKETEDIIVQDLVEEVYEDLIDGSDSYDTVGPSHEISRDYKLDGDLSVKIEFYVIPEIELKDLSTQILEVPSCEVTDQAVNFFIKTRLAQHLERRPLKEGERIGEKNVGVLDRVKYEMVEVDHETGHLLIGKKINPEGEFFDYGFSMEMEPEYDKLGDAFTGSTVGDELLIDPPRDDSLVQVEPPGSNCRVKIKEAYRFDWPEIDDGWASKITDKCCDSSEELNQWVEGYLDFRFKRESSARAINTLKGRMLELHPFSIPSEIVDQTCNNMGLTQDPIQREIVAKHLQFNILMSAIQGQLDDLLQQKSLESESSDQNNLDEESAQRGMMDSLLKLFEVRYIPVSEKVSMEILVREADYPLDEVVEGADLTA
ncbi:MAG: trigger factor [Bacteroidetes bacterium]|nr:trigger factor [Bacteroidota bacterium]